MMTCSDAAFGRQADVSVHLIVRPGSSFTREEREAFEDLVLRAPQVEKQGLSKRIQDAHFLCLLYLNGELVGTNAIKDNRGHQRTIETQAGVSLPDAEYLGEVGYLHVAKDHRRARLGDLLVLGTLAAVKEQGLFTTIQSKNLAPRKLFERHGFIQAGKSWPSDKGTDQVNLYVRPAR